ncbi:type II toxin-antitoxin system Phd/YefM family antitoxin [Acidobacteria bacterium AH-259-O06]|nr:type II toxin-antitoxin system Phd/YefM family antitoxin [Acidobacteria bacterium AH-259-O06]MDA2937880.1 type II toxin-antitoxin system Phd/YefM family antitoxin [Acidobacteria bacterium AH-259-A15]
MRSVSVDELKRRLSSLLKEAAQNEPILVTRHREPIALLTSADALHLSRGKEYGRGCLEPCLKRGTAGVYLRILAEDRRDEPASS